MSKRYVSATELSKLATCERQILFDRQHRTPLRGERRMRAAKGEKIHAAIHHAELAHARAGLRGPAPGVTDSRCFIATAVFGGDARETQILRAFRDRVLMPSSIGRVAVQAYYVASPPIARLLQRNPILALPVRCVLRVTVKILRSFR